MLDNQYLFCCTNYLDTRYNLGDFVTICNILSKCSELVGDCNIFLVNVWECGFFVVGLCVLKNEAKMRNLSEIASKIRADWRKINYGASPYLDAMSTMSSVDDSYGDDSGRSIVLYFLSNASSWRGAKAVLIKRELNLMVK